jgi:Zn-dependent peptidase ImmA (M78 family)
MAKGIDAIINPDLLVWAREESGFSPKSAAEKLGIPQDRLQGWEAGTERPSIPQLRKIAELYKRPLAVFYLPARPKGFSVMHDYRRLPGKIGLSPDLRLEIRKAYHRREIAVELIEQSEDEQLPALAIKGHPSDDPEGLSKKIRDLLKVSVDEQQDSSDAYQALNLWKRAVESNGVLVFQTGEISLDEMRGFSITANKLPVIVLNAKDSPRGRIFTLMHEVTHLALKGDGICDLSEDQPDRPVDQKIEAFCNHVAGAVLLPIKEFLSEPVIHAHKATFWDESDVKALSRSFQVSQEVVLRRLLILGRTTTAFYKKRREELIEEYAKIEAAKEAEGGGGFLPPARESLRNNGPYFTNLVLNAFYNETITSSALSEYLGVRIKHLPKIEDLIAGSRRS